MAAVALASFLYENSAPTLGAVHLSKIQDNHELNVTIELVGDSMGVHSAVTAQNPRTPAEPHLTLHVRAIHEFLETKQLTWLIDMVADPLTKGQTGRNAVNELMNKGAWVVQHPSKCWSPSRQSALKQ